MSTRALNEHQVPHPRRPEHLRRPLNIVAYCSPNLDRPAMQQITVVGTDEEGRTASTLEALRWAETCFDMTRVDNLAAAFDEHSAFAYGLAEEIRKRRPAMAKRHGQDGSFASGFLGILEIETASDARGNRYGLELIGYLKMMHAGMAWYTGLQAAPYKMETESHAYRAMRSRLTAYYKSGPALGFDDDGGRSSPGLMTAFWDQE